MAQAILLGRAGSPGVGTGKLLPIHATGGGDGSTPRVGSATNGAAWSHALELAASQLESLATQLAARAGEDVGAIFEAQALFARDPGIVEPALALVDAGVDCR